MLPTTSQGVPEAPLGVVVPAAESEASGNVESASLPHVAVADTPASGATHKSPLWHRAPDEPYGMPRRFGLGTIMVLTTLFGILLTALIENGVHRLAVALVVMFVCVIGAAQVILFGGKHPRKASIIAGATLLSLIATCLAMLTTDDSLSAAIFALPLLAALGGLFGYASGGVVAGIFLIMDHVEQAQDWIKERMAVGSRQ